MSDDKDKKNNVLSMVDATDNCLFWSIEQLLEKALEDIKSGELKTFAGNKPTKAVLLILDNEGDVFEYDELVCGMRRLEVLNLITLFQHEVAARYHNG